MNAAKDIIRLDRIPEALLDISATELHRLFPCPALIHLPGDRPEPLFISVLLHGNEISGLGAAQVLLKKYGNQRLPRAVSFFFGNVQAARQGFRRLDGQPDFNRIWPGTELEDCPETRWALEIYREMLRLGVFASLDVHNNSGRNPHHACLERLDGQTQNLAALFGRLAVYSTYPKGSQTGAFASACPSVTLECGPPAEPLGVEHAVELIEACLRLDVIPSQPPPATEIDLFNTLVQVKVREGVRFSFSDPDADLLLLGDMDRLNFKELPPGTTLGRLRGDHPSGQIPFLAYTDEGQDVADRYFHLEGDRLSLKRHVMPCMLSMDERIVRQDCLCYLMERMHA